MRLSNELKNSIRMLSEQADTCKTVENAEEISYNLLRAASCIIDEITRNIDTTHTAITASA